IHVLVLIGLVGSAALVWWLKDLLAAAIAAGLFSFLVSLEFYILQAPDVAIAQASIGAGLTTAIFIIAIRAVGRHEEEAES
ncbi:MAG TPA: hydrogenase subunit MbhD domain-containing protein, partial [Methanomicrobiales archaeon]|nr:hydrogenase subunit MbhD domain-containing protein [Methanomicrobiales archaeon]